MRRMPEECAKIKKTLPKDLRDLWSRDRVESAGNISNLRA